MEQVIQNYRQVLMRQGKKFLLTSVGPAYLWAGSMFSKCCKCGEVGGS